ncbi:uncharacterized protein [Heliangelus exortis]|uniref:uncharacterized protein n=1 Tax=Heliangelus exortis TaxID=472823 RepID=UPI003A8C90C4
MGVGREGEKGGRRGANKRGGTERAPRSLPSSPAPCGHEPLQLPAVPPLPSPVRGGGGGGGGKAKEGEENNSSRRGFPASRTAKVPPPAAAAAAAAAPSTPRPAPRKPPSRTSASTARGPAGPSAAQAAGTAAAVCFPRQPARRDEPPAAPPSRGEQPSRLLALRLPAAPTCRSGPAPPPPPAPPPRCRAAAPTPAAPPARPSPVRPGPPAESRRRWGRDGAELGGRGAAPQGLGTAPRSRWAPVQLAGLEEHRHRGAEPQELSGWLEEGRLERAQTCREGPKVEGGICEIWEQWEKTYLRCFSQPVKLVHALKRSNRIRPDINCKINCKIDSSNL